MFTARFQTWVRAAAQRSARHLRDLPLTPNQVTVVGMLVTFAASLVAATGQLLAAGLVLAVSGLFDILDGALARATARIGSFGSFLDSTIDRYSECAVYAGLGAYFLFNYHASDPRWPALACLFALGGSLLVSYARARAEALGFTSSSGLFARPERVVAMVIGLVLGSRWPLALALVVVGLAVLTNVTVMQRMWEVYRQAHPAGPPAPAEADGLPRAEIRRPGSFRAR